MVDVDSGRFSAAPSSQVRIGEFVRGSTERLDADEPQFIQGATAFFELLAGKTL